MNKNIRALSLILLLSAVSHNVSADTKIFVVSAQGTLLETEEGKKASQEVEAMNKKFQEEAIKEQQNLEKDAKDLKVTSTTMSKDSYSRKALELETREQDLKNKVKKMGQEVQLFAQGKMEAIGKNFDKAVQEIAQQKGADLIIDESGRPVYVAETLNLTKDVAVAMNNNNKATQVASAKKDAAAPVAKKTA